MRRSRLVTGLTALLLAPVSAFAEESFPVTGRLVGGAEYEGSVTLRSGDGDAVLVTTTL